MGCACCKSNKIKEQPWKTSMILHERWRVHEVLGKGGYGLVCKVVDMQHKKKKKYVVKFEKLTHVGDTGRLPQEAQVLAELLEHGFKLHLVKIYDKGACMLDNRRAQFIIMTLLGPNLSKLKKLSPYGSFSPETVASIGVQAMDVVEWVHSIGYLHRDIKPDNFCVGLGSKKHEIFLIDFGVARKFLDESGVKTKRKKAPVRGTRPYMSVNVHLGMEHSPRDDLWSLFYTLVMLRTGSLPWAKFPTKAITCKIKQNIMPTRWLKEIEGEYITFFEMLTSIQFDMKPNYDLFRKLLTSILRDLNVNLESPLDWEANNDRYEKYGAKKLYELFSEEPITS